MAELVAEVSDRHKELTLGQSLRVLWALKFTTLATTVCLLLGIGIWAGRWSATRNDARQLGNTLELEVQPIDETLPKLSDAKFDSRSLEQFGADIKRREGERKSLKGLNQVLQPSVYEEDKGKRLEWSGTVTGFYVQAENRVGKFIAVGLLSQNQNATCLFSDSGHMGRLLSLKEGDSIGVTGVLDEHGKLVRCEFIDTPRLDKSAVKRSWFGEIETRNQRGPTQSTIVPVVLVVPKFWVKLPEAQKYVAGERLVTFPQRHAGFVRDSVLVEDSLYRVESPLPKVLGDAIHTD